MIRVRIDRPGGHANLRLEEADDPQPETGQVRIAVEACGVNYADAIIRMGLYASARQLHGYPITPGFEVSGRIDALGEGVEHLGIGQEVLALTLFDGYASAVALPSDRVFPIPQGIDCIHAAALPTVFLTAWYMVHHQVHPDPGDVWLVHSAAGGVGSALCQLGRLAGCRIVGVVGSAHKRAHTITMGTNEIIDKSTEDLWSRAKTLAPDGYQAIFDANGVTTLAGSYGQLAPGGKLAVYGFHGMLPRSGRLNWLRLAWHWLRTPRFNPLDMTQSNRSVLAANLSFLQDHAPRLIAGMHWLLERFGDGRLRPLPVETFPLSRVVDAHRRIESGQSMGKLVLIP